MSKIDAAQAEVVVRPLRFTDHLPRMREFLSLLGFSTRVSRVVSWVTMVGGSGQVALHDAAISATAQSGETGLMFEVPDADALAAQFAEAGFGGVEIYDEAWGRVLRVRDDDTQLSFDERPTDYYGYHLAEPRPEHGIVSMPLLYGPPTDPLDSLLSAAGFVRLDEGDDESGRVWSSTGGGLVTLHPTVDDTAPGTVQLGFRTRERLTELASRLTAAGYAGVRLSAEFGGELTVTDPDDQKVLVQPSLAN